MLPSRFLIGVDSDGTAFDSMNLKHLDAFIPAALEIWPMPEKWADRFAEIEKDVNLYSSLRGINRFPGLLEAFRRLEDEVPAREGAFLPDLYDLEEYIAGESRYSPATLRAWMEKHPSPELEKVLSWSDRADVLFARACEGIEPFPGVREALAEAHVHAAVAVISAAAKSGLEKDWTSAGLSPSVDLLMSQEDGSKAEQLKKARQLSGAEHLLMLGDTESDAEAARAAGAEFFLIRPGEEPASWQEFRQTILPRFLAQESAAVD